MNNGMKRPRVIWFNIDGLRPDIFYNLLDSGRLEGFSRLFSEARRADKCVSIFPTSTIPCQASLITGAMPAGNLIFADAWFDRYGKFPLFRDYRAPKDGLHLFGYRPYGLPTVILPNRDDHPLGEADLSGSTQTLFDSLKARNVRTACVFNPFSRSVNEWVRPARSDLIKYKLCQTNKLPFSVLDKAVLKKILYLIEDEEHLQRVILFNLPGCDGHSHLHGPASQAGYLTNTLDNILSNIINAIDKRHGEKECFFVLTSSYAQTAVSAMDNRRITENRLKSIFDSFGCICYNPAEHKKVKKTSAVILAHGNCANIYIRNRSTERWYDPPRLREDLVDIAEKLMELSKRQRGPLPPGWLDLILINDYANSTYNVMKDGELYGRKEFFSLQVNREKYPGASGRIANLRSKRSSDLILLSNCDEGFHFSDFKYKGQHGGLHREDSLTTLMFAGPGIREGTLPGMSSIIDVVPTIAAIYDLPVLGSEGRILPLFSS